MSAHNFPARLRTPMTATSCRGPVTLPAPAFDLPGYVRTGGTMRPGRGFDLALPLDPTAAHGFPAPAALAHLPAPLRFAASAWIAAHGQGDNAAARAVLAAGESALEVPPFRFTGTDATTKRARVGEIDLAAVLRVASTCPPARAARKVLTASGVIDGTAEIAPGGRLVVEVNRALHIAAACLAVAFGLLPADCDILRDTATPDLPPL